MPTVVSNLDTLDPSDAILVALIPHLQAAEQAWLAHREAYGWTDDTLFPSANALCKVLQAELGKSARIDVDKVKKRLTTLRLAGLLTVVEAQPKRYRWDTYTWRHWPEDDELKVALQEAGNSIAG